MRAWQILCAALLVVPSQTACEPSSGGGAPGGGYVNCAVTPAHPLCQDAATGDTGGSTPDTVTPAGDGGAIRPPQCVTGLKRCDGLTVEACQDGAWVAVQVCGAGEACQAGACVTSSNPCVGSCAGLECGDDGCGNSCGTCPAATPSCEAGLCKAAACAPACGSAECGDDGCGGSCGKCPAAAPNCVYGLCSADVCSPACGAAECGDDGCGGSCGKCPAAAPNCVSGLCSADVCSPACGGAECGDDGCGGSCGSCPAAAPHCVDGACEAETCTPDCAYKVCGPDGCGGDCGTCSEPGAICEEGACVIEVCEPGCADAQCGPDGCGGNCGTCPSSKPICDDGVCKAGTCVPECGDVECGPDGCGGSCGTCPTGKPICEDGACKAAPCTPKCSGKECGPDSCGGSCGTCYGDETCVSGACQGGSTGTGTCFDILECVQDCGETDTACESACAANGSNTAQDEFDAYIGCVSVCTTLECYAGGCSDEAAACFYDGVGTHTCLEIFDCMQPCGADMACQNACVEAATETAQQQFMAVQLCFVVMCPEGSAACVEQEATIGACAGYYATCAGG